MNTYFVVTCHFFMLSAAADTKLNSLGCILMARTAFLWWVSVVIAFPATRSHSLIWQSCDPVITWERKADEPPVNHGLG